MLAIAERLLALMVALGIVLLPGCRNRTSNSVTLAEQQTRLAELQSELKTKIIQFFTAKSNQGWTFKVRDSYGTYMPIALEDLLAGMTADYQQFVLLPPSSDKEDLAIQIKPVEQDLDSGSIKTAVTISSRDLKKIKARDTIILNAKSNDPKGEVIRFKESLEALDAQVSGKKTGQNSPQFPSLLDIVFPKAYASETPFQAVLEVAIVASFVVLSSMMIAVAGIGGPAKSEQKLFLLVFFGSLAVLLVTGLLRVLNDGGTPLNYLDQFEYPPGYSGE